MKKTIRVALLSIVCGLLIWHAVHWYSSGMYLEMFHWLSTGRGYLTVLYNLGLMLVTGLVLGSLVTGIVSLIGEFQRKRKG
jgi:hypothetical protein